MRCLNVEGQSIIEMMSGNRSIHEIIRELQQGIALEENSRILFQRYYTQVIGYLRRKGLSYEDCQDLTQKVFVSVYNGVKDFRYDAKFETWLYRIATNVFITEMERRHALKRSEQDNISISAHTVWDGDREPELQLADPLANPAESLLAQEKVAVLREALLQLPDQMRCCAQLRWVKELSYQEIADVMQISINTVKAHLHQARKLLRERLSIYFDQVGK